MSFKVLITRAKLEVVITTFVDNKALITFKNLSAVNVELDAASKNLFFTTQHGSPNAETITMSESDSYAMAKPLTDIPTILEEHGTLINKPFSDSSSVSESFAKVVAYARAITDTYGLDDTASATDNLQTSSSISKTEVFSVEETLASTNTKALSDAPSIGESYSDVVAYARTFTDTPSISESLGLNFFTTAGDSATISESIDVTFISGASSVLNTRGLNTSALN